MNKTENWVEHDIWLFLEQFGYLVALSNITLFNFLKFERKAGRRFNIFGRTLKNHEIALSPGHGTIIANSDAAQLQEPVKILELRKLPNPCDHGKFTYKAQAV